MSDIKFVAFVALPLLTACAGNQPLSANVNPVTGAAPVDPQKDRAVRVAFASAIRSAPGVAIRTLIFGGENDRRAEISGPFYPKSLFGDERINQARYCARFYENTPIGPVMQYYNASIVETPAGLIVNGGRSIASSCDTPFRPFPELG